MSSSTLPTNSPRHSSRVPTHTTSKKILMLGIEPKTFAVLKRRYSQINYTSIDRIVTKTKNKTKNVCFAYLQFPFVIPIFEHKECWFLLWSTPILNQLPIGEPPHEREFKTRELTNSHMSTHTALILWSSTTSHYSQQSTSQCAGVNPSPLKLSVSLQTNFASCGSCTTITGRESGSTKQLGMMLCVSMCACFQEGRGRGE